MPGTSGKGSLASFAQVDAENVMIESVKHALKGEGTILRLYECYGERSKVTLTLGQKPKAVQSVSLMEDDLGEVAVSGKTVEFEIKPYEIVSFRIL